MEAGIEHDRRRHCDRQQRGDPQHVDRVHPMVQRPRQQHQHGHGHCPRDRRGAAGHRAVEHEQQRGHDRGRRRSHEQQPRNDGREHAEDRDVAAGDRDHVVGARLLQAALVVRRQATAVADQYRGGHSRSVGIARAQPIVDAPADRGSQRCRRLTQRTSRRKHFHQRRTLDAADQHDTLAGERGALVRCAGIEIGRRPAQERGQANGAPGPPFAKALGGQCSRHRQARSAADLHHGAGAGRFDRRNLEHQRDTGNRWARVLDQHSPEGGGRAGRRRLEPRRERRPVDPSRIAEPQRYAGQRSRRNHQHRGRRTVVDQVRAHRRNQAEQGCAGHQGFRAL